MEETTPEKQNDISPRWMMRGAKLLSLVLTPLLIPFLAFVVIFTTTYLSMIVPQYKAILIGMVFCFTVLLPAITILLYKIMHQLHWSDLLQRRNRFVPYMLTIISYGFCLVMMQRLQMPWYMSGVILCVLICLILCLIINLKWKISVHMAGMGGAVGILVAFSGPLLYNPIAGLCILVLLSGCLGTSRIILGRHTFYEVISGFTVGIVCALLILTPASNYYLRMLFF